MLPLHPHNFPLQLWLELGAVGVAIAIAGMTAAILTLRRLFSIPHEVGFAAATIASTVTAAAVGYGAWQGWWLSTIWLAATALAVLAPSNVTASEPQ